MDLSIVLSIVAIAVSVSMSIITLLLTEFRGPNISLLNTPIFEASDEISCRQFDTYISQGYTPTGLELEPVSFVFANHGGRSGTILDLDLDLIPHSSFQTFMERFYFDFGISEKGVPNIPVTIKEGDNKHLTASLRIQLIDWKKTTLAEVLDPSLEVDDMISKALESSKEKFKEFYDFLTSSQELGTISCTIALTKGRFKTKVTEEKLLENIPVANCCEHAANFLTNALDKWENLRPTKLELRNELKRDLEGLMRELQENLTVLNRQVSEQNIGASRLRVDAWNQLRNVRIPYEEKIRWFLIKTEEGLDQDLVDTYSNISKYNGLIDEMLSLGEFRAKKHFVNLNAEREKLHSIVENIVTKLSDLHQRKIP